MRKLLWPSAAATKCGVAPASSASGDISAVCVGKGQRLKSSGFVDGELGLSGAALADGLHAFKRILGDVTALDGPAKEQSRAPEHDVMGTWREGGSARGQALGQF